MEDVDEGSGWLVLGESESSSFLPTLFSVNLNLDDQAALLVAQVLEQPIDGNP